MPQGAWLARFSGMMVLAVHIGMNVGCGASIHILSARRNLEVLNHISFQRWSAHNPELEDISCSRWPGHDVQLSRV